VCIEFIRPNQLVSLTLAFLVLDRHPGPEVDSVFFFARSRLHNIEIIDPLGEKPNTTIDLTKALLTVDVVGILRAITEGCGDGNCPCDLRRSSVHSHLSSVCNFSNPSRVM